MGLDLHFSSLDGIDELLVLLAELSLDLPPLTGGQKLCDLVQVQLLPWSDPGK